MIYNLIDLQLLIYICIFATGVFRSEAGWEVKDGQRGEREFGDLASEMKEIGIIKIEKL